jgi:hypothetical protein
MRIWAHLGCRVCGLAVTVIQGPTVVGWLTCHGAELVTVPPRPCSLPVEELIARAVMRPGQLYSDPGSGLIVLCTDRGTQSVQFADRRLVPLPSAKPIRQLGLQLMRESS